MATGYHIGQSRYRTFPSPLKTVLLNSPGLEKRGIKAFQTEGTECADSEVHDNMTRSAERRELEPNKQAAVRLQNVFSVKLKKLNSSPKAMGSP